MRSNLGFIKKRIELAMRGSTEGGASTLTVTWQYNQGGVLDQGTQAIEGGTTVQLSGTVMGLVHSIEAKMGLRKFTELQIGDLIVDMESCPCVDLYPNQLLSGTMPLSGIRQSGPVFGLDGESYTQCEVGDDLLSFWDARFKGQKLASTIVLRRAM